MPRGCRQPAGLPARARAGGTTDVGPTPPDSAVKAGLMTKVGAVLTRGEGWCCVPVQKRSAKRAWAWRISKLRLKTSRGKIFQC